MMVDADLEHARWEQLGNAIEGYRQIPYGPAPYCESLARNKICKLVHAMMDERAESERIACLTALGLANTMEQAINTIRARGRS